MNDSRFAPGQRRYRWVVLLGVLLVALPAVSDAADESSHSVDQAAAALAVHDGFKFRAVAQEPMVVDPVSARLDMRGRLWVVEMPDYPLGPPDGAGPNGRIKILEDRDKDGLFDQVHLFAEGLSFATGVQPYRDGALVTLAGQIVFIRDKDGDLRGDETTVLFRGFAEQNQQLRANHPTLGPDGLIYIANGLRGGLVEPVDERFEKGEQPLDIRDRDFVFDPEGGWWGAVGGNSQFGLTVDDFGRRIGCSNRNPAMTAPLSLRAIERDPLYAARDAVLDVAAAAERSRVVSRAEAWTTSNLHSGQFSAACGVFAPGFQYDGKEWLLVCEPTAYLVQRQSIQRQGSVWAAERAAQPEEFFASTDTWFRPVEVTAGPANTVFVVDMARAVIEHPDFMPPELKTRPDQRDGDHLGRIWQIGPQGSWPAFQELGSVDQAMQWLQSDSPWQRQVASQFFLESGGGHQAQWSDVVLSESALPQARSRAAWLLHRFDGFAESHFKALAQSNDPRLRALAAELGGNREPMAQQVTALCDDADPLVRRVAASALADTDNAADDRVDALVMAVEKDPKEEWINRTVASVAAPLVGPVALRLVKQPHLNTPLVAHLTERLALQSPGDAAHVTAQVLDRQDLQQSLNSDSVAVLSAWVDGNRRAKRSIAQSLEAVPTDWKDTMRAAFTAAGVTAEDVAASPSTRAQCLGLAMGAGSSPRDLRALFAEQQPPEVRIAALAPLLRSDPQWMRDYLGEQLAAMSIPLRNAALTACSSRAEDAVWLLDQIAAGNIPKTMIDPQMAKRLRQHPNSDVASKAEQLLQADPDRAKVLAEYAQVSQQLGDPHVGKRLFVEHCSACHRIDGEGTNVGPDISDTRTKTPEALLVSILDPNAAIDSAFVQFQILTVDGRVVDGLLIDETADAVTLQQKGGERVTVPRDDIERMQAPGVSLMPEGFERTIDLQAMSHLLSYLKNWRYLKTSIPGTLPE